jgi:hypothetical protein
MQLFDTCHRECDIYVFEPVAEFASECARKLAELEAAAREAGYGGKLRVLQYAVGPTNGLVSLVKSGVSSSTQAAVMQQQLQHQGVEVKVGGIVGAGTEQVQMKTLAMAMRELEVKQIALMMINCEVSDAVIEGLNCSGRVYALTSY